MPTDTALTPAELQQLRDIAGTMIPADAGRRLPGADDPAILADIAASLGRDGEAVKAGIAAIMTKAGGAFAALDPGRREALVNDDGLAAEINALGHAVLAAYYRDGRVLAALGLDEGPPFPKGYTVEQGDWSLLDAVRNRPQLWRDDRG